MTFEHIIIYTLLLLILFILLFAAYKNNDIYKHLLSKQNQLEASITSKINHQFNQYEAYNYIRDRLELYQGLPYTTHWSASPDFLKLIIDHCLNQKPRSIFECSSGLTTVLLARCCQLNQQGKVTSLENGREYADKTTQDIRRYELENFSSVIHAPLKKVSLEKNTYNWYTLKDIPEKSIEMLVIDGPPGFLQKHSRYPAIPLLINKLAEGCVIFLDDAAREDEKEIVEMWIRKFPQLQHTYINTERGCSVLQLPASST